MTFKNLQDDLIAEVEGILSEIKTKNTAGEEVVGVKGYAHQLPVLETDEEDVSQLMPYFIVRFEGVEQIYKGERGGQGDMEEKVKKRLHEEIQKEIAKLI